MKYSIPVISHDLLYKEHAEFFGSRIEPIPLSEHFKSVMEKRNVSRTDLQEIGEKRAEEIMRIFEKHLGV